MSDDPLFTGKRPDTQDVFRFHRRQVIDMTDSDEESEDTQSAILRKDKGHVVEPPPLKVSTTTQSQEKPADSGCCAADILSQLESLQINNNYQSRPKDDGRTKSPQHGTVSSGSGSGSNSGSMLPKHIDEMLFPHQQRGVSWLLGLYRIPSGGILADDMGLGKTMQVTAFITALFSGSLAKRILILAPKSLLGTWMKEIDVCKIPHKCHEYGGDKKRGSRERVMETVVNHGGIVLTAYGMVQHNAGHLNQHENHDEDDGPLWDVVVMDEGHKLKNRKAQLRQKIETIPSKMRLVITGTPIQNNLMELHSLFDLVHPDLLGSTVEFKESFAKPIERGADKDALPREREASAIVSESLRQTYAPFLLRRTKEEVFGEKKDAGETSGNPSLSKKKELVVWLNLSDAQIRLYRAFLESDSVRAVLNETSSALASLTVLKKICDHPALLSENVQDTILESRTGNIDQASDADAIRKSIQDMRSSKEWINALDDTRTSTLRASCKTLFLMNLLKDLISKGHRTLIFSQSRVMLDILEAAVIAEAWTYCRIDGTVSAEERRNRVDSFQNSDSISLFLLTSQVGGLGLTLTAADRVVIVDPAWNPSVDAQSVDRAYRIGQTKDVLVYRLISCGTVEDHIYKKQVFKKALFKAGTEGGDQFRYFAMSELKDLFTLHPTEVAHSRTLKHLESLHGHQRVVSAEMKDEIDSLRTMGHYVGVSDHDLLYSEKTEVPQEVLSKAKLFKPTQTPPRHIAPSSRKGKQQPFWNGTQDQLSSLFDKALDLGPPSQKPDIDPAQEERKKIIEEIARLKDNILANPSIVNLLPDKGTRARARVQELEQQLQDLPEAKGGKHSYNTKAKDTSKLQSIHSVQHTTARSNTIKQQEKHLQLQNALKKAKRLLYQKSLELEDLMKQDSKDQSSIDATKLQVDALLQEYIKCKECATTHMAQT